MVDFVEKYINPFTDFGFKRIFEQEYNKDLLIDFLNSILKRTADPIIDISYTSTEQQPPTSLDRRSVVDIFCKSSSGEEFIVEIQKNKQIYFKDRTLLYASYPIIRQAQRGADWDFRLSAIYVIAIMDFEFADQKDSEEVLHHVKLVELENNKVFYEKLTFVYAEMPKFKKTIDELVDNTDRWLFVLKNLSRLQKYPEKLQGKIFQKLFNEAEIAKYSMDDFMAYQNSLNDYRNNKASIETARIEGQDEGMDIFAALVKILSDAGRYNDINRVSTDKEYRNHLLSEFNLIAKETA